jgi:hypothetical protein
MPKQKALFKVVNVLISTLLVQVPPFLFVTLFELTNASPSEAFFIVCTVIQTFANERASSGSSKSEKAASVAEVWDSAFFFYSSSGQLQFIQKSWQSPLQTPHQALSPSGGQSPRMVV